MRVIHGPVSRHRHQHRADDDRRPWGTGKRGTRPHPHPHRAAGRSRAKARGQHMGRPSKLRPPQQTEAIKRRDKGETQRSVARSYNVSQATILEAHSVMLIEDDYTGLPAEPDLAFIQLERKYRSDLYEAIRHSNQNSDNDPHYLAYINQTIAAAKALTLGIFINWQVPKHNADVWAAYKDFSVDVEHYLVQMKVQNGRRISGHSVALDAATKAKIHHYIRQIREIVLKLEVPQAKMEALVARVTALSDEVDRDRTRFEAYAALTLEVATTAGEARRKIRPAKPLLERIAEMIGLAKEAENARPSLPAPQEAKRLEPPRSAPLEDAPSREDAPNRSDLDDIPF